MFLRSIAFVASATAAGILATPCSAESADIPVTSGAATARISYADLNLANEVGRARLDRRIADAAREMCGKHAPTDLRTAALVQDCRAEAIASARVPTMVAGNSAGGMTYRMSRVAN